ncbi:MAG: hypothetical protein ACE15B_22950 [Bryobacteraceae bacterium]
MLHAALYATLLPLWEGYDEPYHYAYVQHLALRRDLPVLDRAAVGGEIWRSMLLAPTSYLNARHSPVFTSYTDYFALPDAARTRRRAALEALPPGLRNEPGGAGNYEAQQPPLAYLALAPVEWLQQGAPLLGRVWRLRFLGAAVAMALFMYAMYGLGRGMGIAEGYLQAAVFFLFSTQTLYASVAHVANDWLSLPLIPMLFLVASRFYECPRAATAAWFAAAMATGLLAKSYFLVFLPFAFALVLWRAPRRVWLFGAIVVVSATPWYLRNLVLYQSLTGLQTSVRSVPAAAVWEKLCTTSWPGALAGMARAALWSANNSFVTFSAATLNLALLLLGAGWALWVRKRRGGAAQWVVSGGTLFFAVIPIYAMLLFGALHGRIHPGANSWYAAGLLPGALLVSFAGCAAQPEAGRWVARALAALAAYLAVATYFAKLIPLYAGFDGPAKIAALRALYFDHREQLFTRLGQTAMASGGAVLLLACAVALLSVFLCRRVWRETG